MKKIIMIIVFAGVLILSACTQTQYQEVSRVSAGAADPGDEFGWREAKHGDKINYKVKTDWVWTVNGYGENSFILVPEMEDQENASFLLVEPLSDTETVIELAERDMRSAEKVNEQNEIDGVPAAFETVKKGEVTLGDLTGYEWIFNQTIQTGEEEFFSFTRYFLYVQKEEYVYRFGFGIAYNLPENFDELYDDFKSYIGQLNSN